MEYDGTTATVSGGSYADEPEREGSKLPLSDQEKAIAVLHETISQLESKLSAVLVPANREATETNEKISEKGVVSPLNEQLGANNRGIRRASSNIVDLIDRLEC